MGIKYAMIAACLLLPLWAAPAGAESPPPPGERGRWVQDVTPVLQIEKTLRRHRSVRWITEDRFQYIVARMTADQERIELLEAKVVALEETNAALRGSVQDMRNLAEARLRDIERLELDLRQAERSLTRLPRRKKMWLAIGFVAGAYIASEID